MDNVRYRKREVKKMVFTLSVKDIGIALLILAAIICLVYLAKFFKNLVVTVEKSNEILDDVKVMTEIAEKRSRDLDNMVDGIAGSVEGITEAIRGNETLIKQLSAIASAVSSIAGIFNSRKKEND